MNPSPELNTILKQLRLSGTALNPEQLHALVTGLPWQTLTPDHAITVV